MAYRSKAPANFTRRDLYQEVTDKIVAFLEEVQAAGETWTKPYVPTPQAEPVNLDGRAYRGMNWFLLALADAPSGCWATYRRWEEAGAQVRKGEKGTTVTFWKAFDAKRGEDGEAEADENGKPVRGGLMLKHYVVFSAEQVDGFDLAAWQAKRGRTEPDMPGSADTHDAAEKALQGFHSATGVGFGETGGIPCYAPSIDTIRMPPRASFHTTAGYYGVWFHEAAHATGAKSRLDRDLTGRFGSEAYAAEELVAEMAAAMASVAVGLTPEPRRDHACYIASWLKALKDDKRAIFTATSKAQQAADLILAEIEPVTEMPIAA